MHCVSPAVPCILDFRPTGWRIVTTCVEPPVSPLRALETAIDDGRDLPSDWPTTCRAGGFGILHKEIAVSATQPLPGGPPFVLLFFPHIFTHDDISSEGAVGGYEAWDHSVRVADTLPPLLPGQVGSSPSMPSLHDWAPLPARTSGTENSPAYDIVEDVTHAASSLPAHPASDASRTGATKLGRFLGGLFLSFQTSPRVVIGLCLCHVALAMTTQSEPSSPRFVVEAPRPALDAARLAPPPAHQRLQTLWQHGAFEFDGPLWPVPSSGSQQLRFSFKLWGPEDTHILVFLGTQSAREVRTELLRIAGLSGRPRIFSASHGLSVAHVHLVMASTTAALATVLLDAGLEVWCADIPRHASPSQLLALACDLAATDALQVNTEIMPPFRHGDVLPVRLEADHLRVDLTRQILARPDLSASRWLDPVQSFYMLTHSHGLQGFQVAVGAEVTLNLLHSLLPPQERLGGSFLELPARANFPHRVFVHCGRGRDHVVFRVSEASDPSDSGFLFLFAGDFDTYADFARLLGKLQTPAARWLRALRPYGLIVSTWEPMPLTRSAGSCFWYVQLQADIIRAQLHFARVQAGSPTFMRVPVRPAPVRPGPRTSRATQTIAGPGGFPQEIMAWQTPPQPTTCEPGLFPEVSSVLADVWCDAWHVKCLIPCIPGYKAWALRDGDRLLGLCTADITWDLVSQALHLSTWELPQTFIHGDGLSIPYPEPIACAQDKCMSVSHDTPEAVACLAQRQDPPPPRGHAPCILGLLPALLSFGSVRSWPGFGVVALLWLPMALSVNLEASITDASADHEPAPLPFRDYIDQTRTCTMSWTHELSRQTLGFSVRSQILGEHLQRIAPTPEILLQLWLPGQGPTLLQVRPRRLALHLPGFLRALGYTEGVDSLHVAFDTGPHVLDLVAVPPTGGTWWILQDRTGREILRPVVRHYSSAIHFRLLTVSPERVAQTVCPAYGVQQQPLLPQGARGRVIRDLPELHGSLCQGILSFVAVAGPGRRLGASLGLAFLVLGIAGVEAVTDAPASVNPLAVSVAPATPRPQTLRVWTAGVRPPVDLPWKPEGYNTRWLHDFICSIHGVRGAGQFLSTTGAAGDSIMHLLFVPRLNNPAGGQPRFWLFHVEDRASVVYGHHPFDWDIAAAHIRELYQGIPVPSSRPTLVIGSQRIPPSCHLTDVPSGSIIQIPLGALPMEASHDVWDPTPWVLPGPFFQYAPARGPAGEEAISPAQGEVIDSVTQVPATREIACQTDSSYAVDHRLLSAPVVEGLVLQLQGVADCLLSLPFTELGEPTRPPPSSSSSQPAVPVFSGPPLENLSAVETSITVLVAEQDAENSHVSPGVTSPPASTAPRVSRPTSLWCILSLALLGSRDGIRITPGILGLVLSFDPVWGSFFSPNASGSEDEPEPARAVPEGHRPGDGPHYRPAGPPPPLPAGAEDNPDPADV